MSCEAPSSAAWRLQPAASDPASMRPWTLPADGLAVFHGDADVPRLSHYFLPRLLLQGKQVLMLDGANSADPRLLERLARERDVPFAEFSQRIQIARAFTCFQLTELIARVPSMLAEFPARVLIVTAFPDLYFDEDVRDWNARVAFEQALGNLRRWAGTVMPASSSAAKDAAATGTFPQQLAIAIFSSVTTFIPSPARRRFFSQTCAVASEVWKFSLGIDNRLLLACTQHVPSRVNGMIKRSGG